MHTADELCAAAKDLTLASDDIVLGVNAIEATVAPVIPPRIAVTLVRATL